MPGIVDKSKWPLVVVTWTGKVVDTDIAPVIAELIACANRQETWAVVVDFTRIPPLTKAQNDEFVAFTESNRYLLRRFLTGMTFVISSPIMRLMINGVNLVARAPCPVRAVATHQEAIDVALHMLNSKQAVG